MPLHLPGMVKCYIVSNPPLQFVTWFKDKKPFDPNNMNGVRVLANGTLYFSNVSKEHEVRTQAKALREAAEFAPAEEGTRMLKSEPIFQGSYMCSPFNIHGTGGASKLMEVLVREPPVFSVKPKEIHQQRKNMDVTFVCEGKGQPMPTINWRRADGKPLPKQRFSISQGNSSMPCLDDKSVETILGLFVSRFALASALLLCGRVTLMFIETA